LVISAPSAITAINSAFVILKIPLSINIIKRLIYPLSVARSFMSHQLLIPLVNTLYTHEFFIQ
jgi:hypothetical protein